MTMDVFKSHQQQQQQQQQHQRPQEYVSVVSGSGGGGNNSNNIINNPNNTNDINCISSDNSSTATITTTNGIKKSWSELKAVVNDLRKQLSNLSSMVPMNINFRTLSDGRVRIYFLSTPPNGWETTLLYTDIHPGDVSQPSRLQWKLLLEQCISNASTNNAYSREVQLLLERKRLSIWGITSYEIHRPSGKIVFPVASDLYQCLDTGYNNGPLFPTQLRVCPHWAALDPQICPQNSDLIAYVSGGDIWVTHTLSGHDERLTYAHDGRRSFADDPLSAGIPSYVMQEEFNRYRGYWWQPKSDDGVYRIIYEEVDESDVSLFTFPSSQAVIGEYEEYRFPRAGTPNAKSKLKLVQFTLNESLKITDICTKDLPYSLTVIFPWLEYIVRVGWTPDSKNIWIEAMNRKQQRLDLILLPLDNFCETYNSPASSPVAGDQSWKSSFSPLQVLYSETSNSWINVHELLYFLEITDTTVSFIWASEETGFRHLYLITSSLTVSVNGCKDTNTNNSTIALENDDDIDCIDGSTLVPRIVNKVALTYGDWEVLGRNLWIDSEKQLIYFLGLKETPLEKHLYAVSLQRPGHVRLLTEPGYSYSVEFNDDCTLMLQVYCNIQRLPSCKVLKLQQTCQNGGVNGIQINVIGYLLEGNQPESQYCPLIYRPQLDNGDILYAMVFKPHNFTFGVKYPTVLNVYGGPEVQTVNNTFKGMRQLRIHMLAAQGYCVVCVDSRGSRHRGIKFESHLRCRMGQVELQDQVHALRILAEQLGYIDMNRVAIHGWSYGGYLSLMGLVQYPEIFKVAIAGAPVTNWEYYDTGYTERYMDLPQNNAEGYIAGSVLNYIHKFPEEDNRLLIIHGLIDENVHFYHTSQLITSLVKANKPYQLQVYPNERHSLRNLEASKHYETKLLSFLQNNL